jgi:hypothetical protein
MMSVTPQNETGDENLTNHPSIPVVTTDRPTYQPTTLINNVPIHVPEVRPDPPQRQVSQSIESFDQALQEFSAIIRGPQNYFGISVRLKCHAFSPNREGF